MHKILPDPADLPDPVLPSFPALPALLAFDIPSACAEGVAMNLRLLEAHWRTLRGSDRADAPR